MLGRLLNTAGSEGVLSTTPRAFPSLEEQHFCLFPWICSGLDAKVWLGATHTHKKSFLASEKGVSLMKSGKASPAAQKWIKESSTTAIFFSFGTF